MDEKSIILEAITSYPIYLNKKNLNNLTLNPVTEMSNLNNYFLLSGYGNVTKPRVVMNYSIEDALSSMTLCDKDRNSIIGEEYFVHVPMSPSNGIVPQESDVFYCNYVNELWYTSDIKILCIGKIKVKENLKQSWVCETGPKVIMGNAYRYEWVSLYNSEVFIEAGGNDKNTIYIASDVTGIKSFDSITEIRGFNNEVDAVIYGSGLGNREGELTIVDNKKAKYPNIVINNNLIKLDKKFSIYKLSIDGFVPTKIGSNEYIYKGSNEVKVDSESKYDSWVKYLNIITKGAYIFEYKDGLDKNLAIKMGGFYSGKGIWNSITIDEASGKICRSRVETIVINKGKVYLRINDNNQYRIPGGSAERVGTLASQAIAECNEECRLNLKNVRDTGICYTELIDNNTAWIEPGSIRWEGRVSHVFIADFAGKYKGFIYSIDRDYDMSNNGKFYPIDKVYDMLKPQHKQAIDMYRSSAKTRAGFKRISRLKRMIESGNYERALNYIEEITNMDNTFTEEVVVSDIISSINIGDTMGSECVPAFSPEEMIQLGVFGEEKDDNFYEAVTKHETKSWFESYLISGDAGLEWLPMANKVYKEFKSNPTPINKQRLLEAGWNPEVPLNESSIRSVYNLRKDSLPKFHEVKNPIASVYEDAYGGNVDSSYDEIHRVIILCKQYIEDILGDNSNHLHKLVNISTEGDVDWLDDGSCKFGYYCGLYRDRTDKINVEAINMVIQLVNEKLMANGIINYKMGTSYDHPIKEFGTGGLCISERVISSDTSVVLQ